MSFTSSGDAEAFRPVKAMEWRDGCPARPVPSLCSESLRSTRPGDTVGKNAVPSAKADSTLFFARSQHSRAGLISDVAARLGAVGRGRPTLHRNHARIRRSGSMPDAHRRIHRELRTARRDRTIQFYAAAL